VPLPLLPPGRLQQSVCICYAWYPLLVCWDLVANFCVIPRLTTSGTMDTSLTFWRL